MNQTTSEYFDNKWNKIIHRMPNGGDYRFDLRYYGHQIIVDHIGDSKRVFDYACGLGVIDLDLVANSCVVAGCDTSSVAVDYAQQNVDGIFKKTDKLFGEGYDYIIGIQILEHMEKPVEWIKECLEKSKSVIVALPNNFRKVGEHVNLQWSNWDEFNELFKEFNVKRLDEGQYPNALCEAFKHPIFEFKSMAKKVKKTKKKKRVVNELKADFNKINGDGEFEV